MAFTATSSWVPFRSMSPRTAWASALRAEQERTFSLLLMRSSKLGLTSREITEATAVACCRETPPTTRRARQAAISQGTKRRLRFFPDGDAGACSWAPQRERIASRRSGAACSMALCKVFSSCCSVMAFHLLPINSAASSAPCGTWTKRLPGGSPKALRSPGA